MTSEKVKLKNGSTLLVIPLPHSVSVTVMCFIKSGHRFDPVGKEGISHFVEHMFFKGTKRLPTAKLLTQETGNVGALAGGYTADDYNVYTIKCANKHTDLAIRSLTDRVQNSLFRDNDIEKERLTILEERSRNLSNPEYNIWEEWKSNIGKGTSLEVTYLGTPDILNSITRDDLLKFYNENYLSNNTVFVVCGNVDSSEMEQIFSKYLDNYSRKGTQKELELMEDNKNAVRILRQQGEERISIAYGFILPNISTEEFNTLELIRNLIGNGGSCRLTASLRHKAGLIYNVYAQTQRHLPHDGYFVIQTSTRKDNCSEVLDILKSETSRLRKEKVSKEELQNNKERYTGYLLANMETSYDFANWYGAQEIYNPDNVLSVEEKCAKIEEVTSAEIMKVAKKFFTPSNLRISLIGDIKKEDVKV